MEIKEPSSETELIVVKGDIIGLTGANEGDYSYGLNLRTNREGWVHTSVLNYLRLGESEGEAVVGFESKAIGLDNNPCFNPGTDYKTDNALASDTSTIVNEEANASLTKLVTLSIAEFEHSADVALESVSTSLKQTASSAVDRAAPLVVPTQRTQNQCPSDYCVSLQQHNPDSDPSRFTHVTASFEKSPLPTPSASKLSTSPNPTPSLSGDAGPCTLSACPCTVYIPNPFRHTICKECRHNIIHHRSLTTNPSTASLEASS